MAVLLSGLHSGPNPSPGVGTARSLRAAYPDLRLVGVDYSLGSSGLHWPELDDVWVVPSWSELDLPAFADEIAARLDGGSLWLSGLDLETIWLSSTHVAGRILVPPAAALRAARKPAAAVAAALQLRSPPSLPLSAPASELASFGRTRGWQAWVKGPFYEAQRVVGWAHLLTVRDSMKAVWGTDDLHLQAHVAGLEESVAFAAYRGVLLGACSMTKSVTTAEGKTWAGTAGEVEAGLLERITDFVAGTGWTGGAELEMVRDASGQPWLLEMNPRFPAWIHGATLAGLNLPAALVAAALGWPPPAASSVTPQRQFSRVVVEVPVRAGLRLQARQEPPTLASGRWGGSKHPSGMTVLARRLERGLASPGPARSPDVAAAEAAAFPADVSPDDHLLAAALEAAPRPLELQTPQPLLLAELAAARFRRLATVVADARGAVPVRAAYSIKTNPDVRLLALARTNGFLAEAISQFEVKSALDVGYEGSEVVLNGPGKWWPAPAGAAAVRAVFCDSLTELSALTKRLEGGEAVGAVVGVRLRPPGIKSRFGVPTTPWVAFVDLAEGIRQLPSEVEVGVHFHAAQSFIGVERWWASFDAALRCTTALEEASGRPVVCFDVGGGWYPEEWDEIFVPHLEEVTRRVATSLPNCRELVIEPGKALVQPVVAVLTTVLDVRGEAADREVVVDAAVAELPDAASHPHRVFRHGPGGWSPMGPGHHRVLGRSCMEHDVLSASVSIPADVAAGELWAIADAGAYDQSMAYRFARGTA